MADRCRLIGLIASVLATTVAGCGLSTVTSGLSSGMLGSKKEPPQKVASVTEEQLLSAAKTNYGPGGVNVGRVAHGCPKLNIAPSEHLATVYEPGREGDELGVMHRGEITRTARECQIESGRVTVRYGFSGRVLLGPRGQSGRITFPAALTVVDADGQKVADDAVSVSVDVTLENPIGYFSAVRTISFQIPQGSRPGDFRLTVGLPRRPALGSG
ncbi:MAG: hypothetical protein AAF732_03320 [Pseudomonadota bacterium]